MIIVMAPGSNPSQISAVISRVQENGLVPQEITGEGQTVVAVKGDVSMVDRDIFEEMSGVDHVQPISAEWPTIARHVGKGVRPTQVVSVNHQQIGDGRCFVMAGPCSVSSRDQALRIARQVYDAGADGFRAGAFKPRTGPYGFQGLGTEGLEILREIKTTIGLAIGTEATGYCRYSINGRNRPLTSDEARTIRDSSIPVLGPVIATADLPWIGARNGQSFDLIQAAAIEAIVHAKPLMLKRGPWMSIKDYLLALEYIARVGCPVIACLRGIGQHDIYRYQPDIADVQVIKLESTVPVVVDPSHMAGDAKYVKDLALQALAAGADGLLIEVSDDPQNERTDGRQAISPDVLADIIVQAR